MEIWILKITAFGGGFFFISVALGCKLMHDMDFLYIYYFSLIEVEWD